MRRPATALLLLIGSFLSAPARSARADTLADGQTNAVEMGPNRPLLATGDGVVQAANAMQIALAFLHVSRRAAPSQS